MTDEQNKTEPPKKLVSVVQILNIRLREVTASSKTPSLTEPMHFHLNFEHAASVQEKIGDVFVVVATINTRLFGPVEKNAPVPPNLTSLESFASVKAAFEISYKLPEGFAAEPKEIENFAKVNGLFNAWPYFREFVQSSFTRMNFPLVTLPLLRVLPSPPRTNPPPEKTESP